MKPLIGLPGRRTQGSSLIDDLKVLEDHPIDIYWALYSQAVSDAGGLPVNLPHDVDPAEFVERLDGILLTGGADMNPNTYGHEIDGSVKVDDFRDEFEFQLLDSALARQVPVLGICRGLQVINVHAGGTLHQHVPTHAVHTGDGSEPAHHVAFVPDTRLAGIYGTSRNVNSLHHQSIDVLGRNLVVAARSDDGGIEAIERLDAPIISVQWHPEMMATRSTDPIFRWLVETSGR